jgi:hypothetical protein
MLSARPSVSPSDGKRCPLSPRSNASLGQQNASVALQRLESGGLSASGKVLPTSDLDGFQRRGPTSRLLSKPQEPPGGVGLAHILMRMA